MSSWFYIDSKGQRHGPVTAEALTDLFNARDIRTDALVWREGLAEWRPLSGFMSELGLPATGLPPPLPEVPTGGTACSPQATARPISNPIEASLSQPSSGATAIIVYAGFWRRYLALVVDQLVLVIPLLALMVALGFMLGLFKRTGEDAGTLIEVVYFVTYLVIAPLYYGLQESSRHQATLGKRALGIKVTDLAGNRIGFGQALGRWFAASLSYLTMYIGFLMAAFTSRKQALHDIVASTLVTDHWAYTAHPERQKHGLSGCLVVVLVVLVAGIPILAILAAIAIPAYQQYLTKATVAQTMATATTVSISVSAFRAENSRCPTNGEGDLGGATSYANDHIASIQIGPMQDGGQCGIQVTLKRMPGGALDGKHIWLEQDASTGTWHCSSDMDDRSLPSACRG